MASDKNRDGIIAQFSGADYMAQYLQDKIPLFQKKHH